MFQEMAATTRNTNDKEHLGTPWYKPDDELDRNTFI